MRTTLIIGGIVLLLVLTVVVVLQHPAFGWSMSAERKARIEASPHYRDGMFRNQLPTPQFTGNRRSLKTLWSTLVRRNSRRVPASPLPAVKTDLGSLPADRDWFVWFGHSSYMFQLGGKRFLVDPLLKMEFPPALMLKPFAGTDIYTPDDIPDIDYLIITHEHWDHLDYATLRDLRGKVRHTVCPLGVGEYLEYWGYDPADMAELDWFQTTHFPRVDLPSALSDAYCSITCLPSRHFSNRLLRKRDQTLWAAFVVQVGERKVYIGGDGGYDHRFIEVREHFGTIDLAVMENGQYNPNWAHVHMLPQDLLQAVLDLQPKQVITVHHNKFALSTHAWDEPDSVAHNIARHTDSQLLDQPIGTIVYF